MNLRKKRKGGTKSIHQRTINLPVFDTIVIPELQFYFGMFVKSTTLNKDEIPFPAQLNREDLCEDRSFIRLLFDDEWPPNYTHYYICYRKCASDWPPVVQTRANLYSETASYWVSCDCTASFATNIFNLGNEEIDMLNQLLMYRLDPCEFPAEWRNADIHYSTLTTDLGKLIWFYLNLKATGDFMEYEKIVTPIANPHNTLENMYEVYLIETIFNFVQQKGR
jgi:hypothetical protein